MPAASPRRSSKRSAARRIASTSSAIRASYTSARSITDRSVTRAPRCGMFSTSPAASSRLTASRIGIGLMSSTSASSSIGSRAPGRSRPVMIAQCSVSNAFSASVRCPRFEPSSASTARCDSMSRVVSESLIKSQERRIVTREHAQELDAADPLREFRERFVIDDELVYLDGNSLGRLPRATVDRLAAVCRRAVGQTADPRLGRGLAGAALDDRRPAGRGRARRRRRPDGDRGLDHGLLLQARVGGA